MNEKGFTLTELLVTIAILGIIMVIALPAVSNIKTDNQNEEYKAYAKIIKTGAKLYVEENTLFGNNQNRDCKQISVQELITNNLVNEYNKNGINCNDSYVVIEKNQGSYDTIIFTPVIKCIKNGTIVYELNNDVRCD